jgi:6-pyruvoyltetrahydropterin/6-carboxytetrahydropterin synthase
MRLNVSKEFSFAGAHSLPDYKGPCARLHGHEWKLQVEVSGEIDEVSGMVLDFVFLKKVVTEAIINKFDHQHLNDMFVNPTAENIVQQIVYTMSDLVGDKFALRLERITLWETPTSFCEWRRVNEGI